MTLTKILVPICFYCLNCTKFVQLILRKIIKIVATRCQILRLKCTKFDFGWGSALPQTPLGELTALSRPLAGFQGLISKRKEGRGKGREGEGKGSGREGWKEKGEGRGGEGRRSPKQKITTTPLSTITWGACTSTITSVCTSSALSDFLITYQFVIVYNQIKLINQTTDETQLHATTKFAK